MGKFQNHHGSKQKRRRHLLWQYLLKKNTFSTIIFLEQAADMQNKFKGGIFS